MPMLVTPHPRAMLILIMHCTKFYLNIGISISPGGGAKAVFARDRAKHVFSFFPRAVHNNFCHDYRYHLLSNMNTFSDCFSETKVTSVYGSLWKDLFL